VNRNSIACSLDREGLAKRGKRWLELGARAAVEVAATDRGLRLAFRADEGVEDELRRLAKLERECCAFADWSLHVGGEEITLELAAEGEAVPVVREMLSGLL